MSPHFPLGLLILPTTVQKPMAPLINEVVEFEEEAEYLFLEELGLQFYSQVAEDCCEVEIFLLVEGCYDFEYVIE